MRPHHGTGDTEHWMLTSGTDPRPLLPDDEKAAVNALARELHKLPLADDGEIRFTHTIDDCETVARTVVASLRSDSR
jgi:hypothetical protein